MVEGRSDVTAVVVGKMEEACSYSQVFHDQQRTSSDVLNDLALPSGAHPARSFSANYNMEDPKVVVDGRRMQELQREDATKKGIVVDLL